MTQSISQRAAAGAMEIPKGERSPSELYRLAAKEWVELDGAARIMEESKTAVLAQEMKKLGDVPAARAERDVKASEYWSDYIQNMVSARTRANLAKVKMEWTRMKFKEFEARNYATRQEMGLSR